jgi:N-acetylglutamate synthase-like GNAT family acetyltransferase
MTAEYDIKFPGEADVPILEQACALIHLYAEEGLMLDIAVDTLSQLAAAGMLALAVTPKGEVVGSIAYTYVWPDGKTEMGGWAVKKNLQHKGIGEDLLTSIVHQNGQENIIAFGNHNSGPILQKMGAIPIPETEIHPSAFEPCLTCKCDKSNLPVGRQCVDTIFDMTPVIQKIVTTKKGSI